MYDQVHPALTLWESSDIDNADKVPFDGTTWGGAIHVKADQQAIGDLTRDEWERIIDSVRALKPGKPIGKLRRAATATTDPVQGGLCTRASGEHMLLKFIFSQRPDELIDTYASRT